MASPMVKMAAHPLWVTAGAVAALGLGCLSLAAASPEEEIARLNRIRANLFEELLKTRREVVSVREGYRAEVTRLDQVRANLFEELVRIRREAAAARAQLEATSTDRDRAHAELARVNQTGSLAREPSAEVGAADPQIRPAAATESPPPPTAAAAEGPPAQVPARGPAKDTTSKPNLKVQDKAVRREPSAPGTARKASRGTGVRTAARVPARMTFSNPKENERAETYSSWATDRPTAPAALPSILRLQQ
jgi:hypothetical protein